MSEVIWNEERPASSEKSFRTSDGSAYVARSPKKFWRVWIRDAAGTFVQTRDVFKSDDDAKASAEAALVARVEAAALVN